MEQLRNIENMEAYIKGTLDTAEKVAFEELLSQDKAFKQEVDFQRDVIHGIQSYRKAMLKAKLKEIDAQMTSLHGNGLTTSVSVGLKVASVVLVSAVVSVGTYYWLANSAENLPEQVEIVHPIVETQSAESNPTPSGLGQEHVTPYTISEASSESSSKANKNQVKTNSNNTEIVHKKSMKIAVPKDIEEHIVEAKDELEVGKDTDNPKEIKAEINVKKLSDIDVQTVDDGTHAFHYKMENQTLQLYGKFDASPYEILEFNDKNGVHVYLYYNQKYYNLEDTRGKISKLKALADNNLVKILEYSRTGNK